MFTYPCSPVCYGYPPHNPSSPRLDTSSMHPCFCVDSAPHNEKAYNSCPICYPTSHPHAYSYPVSPRVQPSVCTCSRPRYPFTARSPVINTHTSISESTPEELTRVIIQFDIPALLQKFPSLNTEELSNHPYLLELKQKYNDWINTIRSRTHTFHLHHTYDLLVSGVTATLPKSAIEKVRNLPFIIGIYPDKELMLHRAPRYFDYTTISQTVDNAYNLQLINVLPVREMTNATHHPLDGQGIIIAVMDGGFDFDQLPERNILQKHNFSRFLASDDDQIHGTITTKIILEVAPEVGILAYQVRAHSEMLQAFEEAIRKSVTIISRSMSSVDNNVEKITIDAIATLRQRNVILVNSSGNDGSSNIRNIAALPDVITVGATSATGDEVAEYSNYDTYLQKPDIVAPGTYRFLTSRDTYRSFRNNLIHEGTSIAAPYVSGSIALLKQKHPGWTLAEIMPALATTATRIRTGTSGSFIPQGSGRINVLSAINTQTFISPIHMTVSIHQETGEAPLFIDNQNADEQTYFFELPKETFPSDMVITLPTSVTVAPNTKVSISLSVSYPSTFSLPFTQHTFSGEIQIQSNQEKWHIPIQVRTVLPAFAVNRSILSLSFSPDGKFIALSSPRNETIEMWDTTPGNPVKMHSVINTDVVPLSISWNPDGKSIASGSWSGIRIWDVQTQQLLTSAGRDIGAISFSPDGEMLVSGGRDTQLWSTQALTLLRSYIGDSIHPTVSFSLDGKWIASGYNKRLLIRDIHADTRTPFRAFTVDEDITAISFIPFSTWVASGSKRGKIALWDIQTGNPLPIHSFQTNAPVTSISVSPNGNWIASGSKNGEVFLWNISTNTSLLVYKFQDINEASVTLVSFAPDGRLAFSGSPHGLVFIISPSDYTHASVGDR